jgi:hypothetical protein
MRLACCKVLKTPVHHYHIESDLLDELYELLQRSGRKAQALLLLLVEVFLRSFNIFNSRTASSWASADESFAASCSNCLRPRFLIEE